MRNDAILGAKPKTAFGELGQKSFRMWKMVDASQVTVTHYGIIVTGLILGSVFDIAFVSRMMNRPS
jgi:hypothetical protein